MAQDTTSALLAMTTGILANYVANNRVSEAQEAPAHLTSAAIRKLVTPGGITSLIDGRRFKSMRRHLTLKGYTPESYRTHFGFPDDFPMVAPEYAAQRSALAKAAGLGVGGRQPKKTERIAGSPRTTKV